MSKQEKSGLQSLTFKVQWSVDYFITELDSKAMCFLMQWHYSYSKRMLYVDNIELNTYNNIPNSQEIDSQKK